MSIEESTAARAARIWRQMGFAETDTGPYASELRAVVARQVEDGLQYHSPGTWAAIPADSEERAKHLLAFEWAVRHGQSRRVECMDPVFQIRTSLKDGKMRRYPALRWRRVPARIRDAARYLAYLYRVKVRDRGLVNPYV